MARKNLLIALILSGTGCSAPPAKPVAQPVSLPSLSDPHGSMDPVQDRKAPAWNVLAKDPSTVVFDNRDTLRTGLPIVHPITNFLDPNGRAWFVFSGLKGTSNKAATSLFVLCPGDSSAIQAIEQPWHMPGRLMSSKDTESYYEAQVFAGEVLRDTIGVIWYERYLMPDRTWRINTTLLNLSGPQPDTLVLFGHGRKSSTIALAFRGKCQLLDSVDQRLEP